MTPAVVRTVLGDIDPAALGRTDYHEHLFQRSPLLPGEDLDDQGRSLAETAQLRDSGFDAIVDLTPIGLGRRPRAVAEISRHAGVHVVAATGIHRHGHYPTGHPAYSWDEDTLAERFVREVESGIVAAPGDLEPGPGGQGCTLPTPQAGVIKIGIGYWEITAFEEKTFAAAARAHAVTGVSVVCHLELGTAAFEAADLLERHGLPRSSLVLAHMDRNPDPGLHTELADSGVFLGYDGAARAKYWPDSVLIECLVEVARRGGGRHVLLGGDVARRSGFAAYGGIPGMAYLGRRFVPRLVEAGGRELVTAVLVDNAARAFSFTPA